MQREGNFSIRYIYPAKKQKQQGLVNQSVRLGNASDPLKLSRESKKEEEKKENIAKYTTIKQPKILKLRRKCL